MKNETELSRAILTSEKGQYMADCVAPVYSDGYVALWLFQAIGSIMGEVYGYADMLRDETTPARTTLLIDYWERHYDIPKNSSLTIEQRRLRLLSRTLDHAPCNPKKMEAAISSALGGVEVEITENVAKNTFLVNIREVVYDLKPAIAVIERKKPAHLIYQIRVATQMVSDADLKTAVAATHAELYHVEVVQ